MEYNSYFTEIVSHIGDSSEVEMVDRYTRGLYVKLYKEEKIRNPETLSEAMHIASTHDSVRRQASYSAGHGRRG